MTKPDKPRKINTIQMVLNSSPVALSPTSIADIIREPWCMTGYGKPYGTKVAAVLKTMPDALIVDEKRGLWTLNNRRRRSGVDLVQFINESIDDNKDRIFARRMRDFAPVTDGVPIALPSRTAGID